ncbi:isochorismate synthase [Terrihabitans sp. B22-R8]|uniref:isochorismate synthase n=1 Tax=Terrihabitans sp. B22-R8 TaxID=3425128 RepID=UPI00403CB526
MHALAQLYDDISAPDAPFSLTRGKEKISAQGQRHVMAGYTLAEMGDAARAFFAGNRNGPDMLTGALPFDRDAACYLFQPDHLGIQAQPPFGVIDGGCRSDRLQVRPQPSTRAYAAGVRRALALIAAEKDGLRRIVLARSLFVSGEEDFDIPAILRRLSGDPGTTAFCVPLAECTLVGATPELLVSKTGTRVASHPLAGSAKRLADPVRDEDAARALLACEKDRREHAAMIEAIADVLAPYCRSLCVPETPRLLATKTLWHLATRIEGELRDPDISSLDLAAALHPTPAVCGMPRPAAIKAVKAIEPFDRGFYSGAVGWCDSSGDGEWHVAIRCAEISGHRARLYAGAGIVAGSDPDDEIEETAAKFMALLDASASRRRWAASEDGDIRRTPCTWA